MAYPSTITALTNPNANDKLHSPSHSSIETAQNTAITELQTYVGVNTGTNASAVGTLLYDIKSPLSNGGGHVQSAAKGGTGQTTFTKGDVLVAINSSTLTKLAIGTNDQVLVADSSVASGIKWGATPVKNVQSFLSTGTWVKPTATTNSSRIFVELWGAGGSGACADGAGEAGGGGGGGYIAAWVNPSTVASSVMVGIGVGGNSVGSNVSGIGGSVTVFDTFNSILTAWAGGGGGYSLSGGGGGGGAGLVSNAGSSGDANGGIGGLYFTGMPTSRLGTGGATNNSGSVATLIGSACGGGGGGGDGAVGAISPWGGAGGGGARSNAMGAGGVSQMGGSGGAGSIATSGSVQAGFTPGGGGGAAYVPSGSATSSGQGGGGKAVITTFY